MRKFTIFCLNREYLTATFLLLVLSVLMFGCKSDTQAPKPQDIALYGAWQETVVYNYTYQNNVLVRTDTLPVMNNKAIMYTVFKHDGTFQSYEVSSSNTMIDEFDGPFTYTPGATSTLSQTWPSPANLTTPDKYNVGALKTGFASPSTAQALTFTAVVSTNSISLVGTIYADTNTFGNYVVQSRQLTRWQSF